MLLPSLISHHVLQICYARRLPQCLSWLVRISQPNGWRQLYFSVDEPQTPAQILPPVPWKPAWHRQAIAPSSLILPANWIVQLLSKIPLIKVQFWIKTRGSAHPSNCLLAVPQVNVRYTSTFNLQIRYVNRRSCMRSSCMSSAATFRHFYELRPRTRYIFWASNNSPRLTTPSTSATSPQHLYVPADEELLTLVGKYKNNNQPPNLLMIVIQ